ncbi:MAG TPA: OmpA family protein [Methylomirabilota bacterium]
MAIDLVDLVKGYFTPDLIQNAATLVGESPATTQKALAGIVPTLVGALANTGSTSDGAQQLTRILDGGKYDGSALDNVVSLFGGGKSTQGALSAGKGILDSLFAGKLAGVTELLARFAGVRTESASSLLALATPLVMHVLGSQRAAVGRDPGALASLLGEQKSLLRGLVPAGLGSLLGWSGASAGVPQLGVSVASASSPVGRQVVAEPAETERPSWIFPLVVLGALALAAITWLNWPTTQTATEPPGARKMSLLQLPDGAKISVPESSFNASVANWLGSTADVRVPKRFVFEDLNFETASTTLTPDSVATVNSLVAVLKAYPAAAVALEGYTDNTGDPISNKKLSLDRAVAVKDVMVKGGIVESRITTAGYGQDNPVASNETEDGRAKNRRLELVVVKR